MTSIVRDNPELERYEMRVEGGVAFVNYRRSAGVVTLLYAEVPRHLAGRGLGAELARGTFDCVRAEGNKAVPVCSYLVAWAKRHPEVHDLLA
jgi:predicted GNAT family acetyltransferase